MSSGMIGLVGVSAIFIEPGLPLLTPRPMAGVPPAPLDYILQWSSTQGREGGDFVAYVGAT